MTNSTHAEGQSKNSDPADPLKQTASQILLFEAKLAQLLASREPKVLASL